MVMGTPLPDAAQCAAMYGFDGVNASAFDRTAGIRLVYQLAFNCVTVM
jgi:hypothetical protein